MREESKPTPKPSLERRDFLKLTTAAAAGALAQRLLPAAAGAATTPPANPAAPSALPMRNLGRTGYAVGVFSLGGQAAIEQPDNEDAAVAIVERALDLGVNYIDTAAFYGDGMSQRYIGKVMQSRRREAFLATKSHDRTRDGALRHLEESLRSLQTDHVDLWQVHNLSRLEQVERIFAAGGAMEAFIAAREQKLVRWLGVTGHADPQVLAEAIRRFPFDTVLMAVNAADKHHLSFIDHLLPLAVEKQMGIIGMKVPARGRLLVGWTPPAGASASWEGGTQPGALTMRQAVHYVLTLPVSTIIIGCDSVAQLEENVALAREFTPLSDTQMAALVEQSEPIHRQALFFRRWT
jgi:hypothetical protein